MRSALDIGPAIPILLCDVRRRESSNELLIALTQYVLELSEQTARQQREVAPTSPGRPAR